jgi:hypothetical protein
VVGALKVTPDGAVSSLAITAAIGVPEAVLPAMAPTGSRPMEMVVLGVLSACRYILTAVRERAPSVLWK